LGVRVNYRPVAPAPAVSVRPIYLRDGKIVALQDEVGRGGFRAPGELLHPHAEETRLSADGVGLLARSLARHYSSTVSPDHFHRAKVGEDEFNDWHQREAERGWGGAPDLEPQVRCAGINRQEAEDEKSLRGRKSEPLGPEFCAVYREVRSEA
jgi:hypothetical protein